MTDLLAPLTLGCVPGLGPGSVLLWACWTRRQRAPGSADHYRRPFVDPGESRRPTLSWPRNIPIDGKPPTWCRWSTTTAPWLAESDVPKLFVSAEPGALVRGRIRDVIRSWPNLTETTVSGRHFVQEHSPDQIGTAVAQFVRKLRALAPTGRELASGHHPVGRTQIHPSERQ